LLVAPATEVIELQAGGQVEELKNRFAALIKQVKPEEIARLEQQLIEEGLPEDGVRRLCDLHIKNFEESLEALIELQAIPGHPVHTLMSENRAAEKWLEEIKLMIASLPYLPGDVILCPRDRVSRPLYLSPTFP